MMMDQKFDAILLMGPTGVGKTPLGDLMEKGRIEGRSCHHFDFGRNLRKAGENAFPKHIISVENVRLIRKVLSDGVLLENETFYIAECILSAFIEERQITRRDLLVMNGLPRHIDQAEDTAAMVRIQSVIVLECPPEVVFERIRTNSGGDRLARTDDSLTQIRNKLAIYEGRTLPLLDYFAARRIPVQQIPVNESTSPEDIITSIY